MMARRPTGVMVRVATAMAGNRSVSARRVSVCRSRRVRSPGRAQRPRVRAPVPGGDRPIQWIPADVAHVLSLRGRRMPSACRWGGEALVSRPRSRRGRLAYRSVFPCLGAASVSRLLPDATLKQAEGTRCQSYLLHRSTT